MIRQALLSDLETILDIYDEARVFMGQNGNPSQWRNGYPSKGRVTDDIKENCLFVIQRESKPCGVFFFKVGEDPTYRYIENGKWLSDTEYGVIHRIAGRTKEKGIFAEALEFCQGKITHLRIDTHKDNSIMQHALAKYGFTPCGTIYVADGTPRIAYERL
ncbi:MAG: GNAT family N-acetyltransferase [Candidatus Treponema excrementipullorum]|uniref:GNAT family N-acetyltransferase n=1 Tax=Candidatus Treponema excrementipullorum TaxID=2838768 RepID=A0A9E2L1E4_9SPIR|nr:GNAT family N-acetyltransferase [Candidatus Treponema excrementipullorum]